MFHSKKSPFHPKSNPSTATKPSGGCGRGNGTPPLPPRGNPWG